LLDTNNIFKKIAIFISGFEIWIVVGLVILSIALERYLLLTLIVSLIFWLIRLIVLKRPNLRTPADFCILLLILTIPVTLWVTTTRDVTAQQVIRLLIGIILFYEIINWALNSEKLYQLYIVLSFAGFFLALLATVSVDWFTSKLAIIPPGIYNHFSLIVADTIHPNVMAGYLVILFPLPAAILLFDWRETKPILKSLLLVICTTIFTIIILTQSRGAWVGLSFALLLLFFLRWRRGGVIVVFGLLLLLSSFYYIGIKRVLDVLASTNSINGVTGRLDIWNQSLAMIRDFPFTGIGMGSFEKFSNSFYPLIYYRPGQIPHAHNLFLQIAIDLGIPGLIAWLGIIITTFYTAFRTFIEGNRSISSKIMGISAGLLASQVALIFHGLTDAVVWGMVKPAPLVWVVLGTIIALGNLENSDHKDLNIKGLSSYKQ
jgi:putative inorganic carbon (HCO3(-)) transporter